MNRKGFTLVEILAVVGILAILGVIVIPKITKVKKENIIKLYKEQEDRLKEKAGEYMNDNYISENIDSFVITKDQLIEGGYISELYDLKEKAKECEAFVYVSSNTTIPKVTPYLSCSGYTTENYSTYSNLTEYSVTNLVKNGSFEEGTKNWSFYAKVSVSNVIQKYNGFSVKNYQAVQWSSAYSDNIYVLENHIYYVSEWFYTKNKGTGNCYGDISIIYDSTNHYTSFGGQTNLKTWEKNYKLFTIPASTSPYLKIFAAKYSQSDALQECYSDGVLLVDLTATFGAGNEPTQAWCSANLDYFDGTKILNLPI